MAAAEMLGNRQLAANNASHIRRQFRDKRLAQGKMAIMAVPSLGGLRSGQVNGGSRSTIAIG